MDHDGQAAALQALHPFLFLAGARPYADAAAVRPRPGLFALTLPSALPSYRRAGLLLPLRAIPPPAGGALRLLLAVIDPQNGGDNRVKVTSSRALTHLSAVFGLPLEVLDWNPDGSMLEVQPDDGLLRRLADGARHVTALGGPASTPFAWPDLRALASWLHEDQPDWPSPRAWLVGRGATLATPLRPVACQRPSEAPTWLPDLPCPEARPEPIRFFLDGDRAGWAALILRRLGVGEHMVLSNCCPPLRDMLAWIEELERAPRSLTLRVDEERGIAELTAQPLGQTGLALLTLCQPHERKLRYRRVHRLEDITQGLRAAMREALCDPTQSEAWAEFMEPDQDAETGRAMHWSLLAALGPG